ncbi:M42 family metallopeptidase [Anaerolineales bacterium]
MFDVKDHLENLSNAHGPSGHEKPIRLILEKEWARWVDETEVDGLGSFIGIKRATHPIETPRKIMLSAHMDEIGLMVRDIVDGFIYVARVAGLDSRLMLAQPVVVHGKRPLKGVVATVPPHMLDAEERKNYPPTDALVVDVGLDAATVNELVQVGDLITTDTAMMSLQNGLVSGKAFDDRACVAVISHCLAELQKMHHHWDVYATASVQEENGLYGATTAAYHINPDIAIALDVTFAPQPGVPQDSTAKIGEGPAIGYGANFHPKLYQALIDTATYYEIPHQIDILPASSGTDAWAIQVAREGIPSALLSIPIRNMHSPVETLDIKDIQRAGRWLAQFIASLDADFMPRLNWDEIPE